jgi:hypothetical protein
MVSLVYTTQGSWWVLALGASGGISVPALKGSHAGSSAHLQP